MSGKILVYICMKSQWKQEFQLMRNYTLHFSDALKSKKSFITFIPFYRVS